MQSIGLGLRVGRGMVKAARVGVAAWDGAAGHAAEVEARVARVPASPRARAAAGVILSVSLGTVHMHRH